MDRRGFLTTTATAGALVAWPGQAVADQGRDKVGPVSIRPGDPRYEDLVLRPINRRFAPRPESFRIVGSTDQVVRVVNEAVRAGKRVTVRSGGHCYENFVGDPQPHMIIDMVEMNAVYFDDERNAFVIEPGALLSDVYRTLYYGWGVTIPGGQCGTVAAGGHIQGGAYGPLSRAMGSVVDYLYAVEVVVVDRSGRARAIVATREPDDPNHDLWWAHTGAGGGNFGVVTRYWLRSPGATGNDPTKLLPKPPPSALSGIAYWSWKDMSAESFRRLIRNHGEWHERNSAPGNPNASLFSVLMIGNQANPVLPGELLVTGTIDGSLPDAAKRLKDYFDAVTAGVGGGTSFIAPAAVPFLANMRSAVEELGAPARQKNKAAYLRKTFADSQIDTIYGRMSKPDPSVGMMMTWLVSYGGQVNAVSPAATAMPQRDAILKVVYIAAWQNDTADPGVDARNIDWIRQFYKSVYAGTGGVPVPNGINDGSYINYPDIDLADPAWNTSGVPWHALYYQGNYPRLQRVKAKYDPRDLFTHKLGIRPA
ncbi:aclacinomycin oxidase [Kibdelosporangium banguiense]|uniref:Aclacinomycin oxidase n=1 Tax=Kibdelosporangium banguiense TaxID=1365924 RepID=A0ABS4TL79_9PSEU|nr:FAD-binding oxidoreductase [Kibdelosporangium banguiense]MBP2325171.1 aclacinomycin oxidase [Kibdelosporangium banguiense]